MVDVRHDSLRFFILRRGRRGFVATRKDDHWVKSAVLGRQFNLTCRSDRKGQPEFMLAVR